MRAEPEAQESRGPMELVQEQPSSATITINSVQHLESSSNMDPHQEDPGTVHIRSENNGRKCRNTAYVCMLLLVVIAGFFLLQRVLAIPKREDGKITAIFISEDADIKQALQAIKYFMVNRGGQRENVQQIILGCACGADEKTSQDLANLGVRLVLGGKMDYGFLDMILASVATPYWYLSTSDWLLIDSKFLSLSKDMLRTNPKVAQVVPALPTEPLGKGELKQVPLGFSFLPSLHRVEDYKALDGQGFQSLASPNCPISPSSNGECLLSVSWFFLERRRMYVVVAGGDRFKNVGATNNKEGSLGPLGNEEKSIKQKQADPDSRRGMISPTPIGQPNKPNSNPIGDAVIDHGKTIDRAAGRQESNGSVLSSIGSTSSRASTIKQPVNQTIENITTSNYLEGVVANLRESPEVHQLHYYTGQQYDQLLFCIVDRIGDGQRMREALRQQNYTNYILVNASMGNHSQQLATIELQCGFKSLVLFLNQPLAPGALRYLSRLHQRHRAYLTYSLASRNGSGDGDTIEIHSVLGRVHQLLLLNDFTRTNRLLLEKGAQQVIGLGLLELAGLYTKKVNKSKVMAGDGLADLSLSIQDSAFTAYQYQNGTTLHAYNDSGQTVQYHPYQGLLKLSQDMPIREQLYELARSIKEKSPYFFTQLNSSHMHMALEREELPYLPEPHLIQAVEHSYYAGKYNMSMGEQEQVRFCVTIISHNNVQHNRYRKLLDSLLQQVYNNYHIVFIDDNSSDGNLQATARHFRQVGFNMSRVALVSNKVRNYATYNILNAAHNYCEAGEVQLMIDGDDELIGRYSLRVISSVYQADPSLWIVYSNYKNSEFNYGISKQFTSQAQHLDNKGKRKAVSYIGPIRTWRVELIRAIPMRYHKMLNGQWLDTVSDDALQHPLIELAGVGRSRYIVEIMYEYNVKYGDNDNSSPQKLKHRGQVYRYLLKLKPLPTLPSLALAISSAEVETALKRDKGSRYQDYYIQE